MPASRAGLFETLRQLLATSLELAQVRLELLVSDLELEKHRLLDVALRALLGLLLIGLGLLMLAGIVMLLLWENNRLPALVVLTLLFVGGGLALLRAARVRLHDGASMLEATRAELERDLTAVGTVRRRQAPGAPGTGIAPTRERPRVDPEGRDEPAQP